MKAGTDLAHFTFIGKPGLKVKSQNSENSLECFTLFIITEMAELIRRENNQYAQQFPEQNSHPK